MSDLIHIVGPSEVQTEFECPEKGCTETLDMIHEGVTPPDYIVECQSCGFTDIWVSG